MQFRPNRNPPKRDAPFMPRIQKLDAALVNQIAAGEVIERPGSVVKELVENALDAGATRIDIALEEGGVRLIRVTDNGGGIEPDDLPLALAPHATSKLRSADDLFRVGTLGFRGEALASIASVSRLTVRSRTPDRDEASSIEGDGDLQPCAAPIGTTVEVRNLFYNVPARRKFLRQAPTELSHVTEQLARLALAHPTVGFTLTHNGRTARDLPATPDRRTRIADFYGADLAECLIPIARDERGLAIEALIAPPAQSRATSKWQYVFLNGRCIVDRRIGYAIREAYRGLIEAGRYPVVFIFLRTAPEEYDVNVHPTKIEVRWRDAGLVQSQVLAFLRDNLLSRDLAPPVSLGGSSIREAAELFPASPHASGVRRAVADYLKSIDPTQARLRFEPPRFASPQVRPTLASDYAAYTPARHDPIPRMESPIEAGALSEATENEIDGDTASTPSAPSLADDAISAESLRSTGDALAADTRTPASPPRLADALGSPAIQIHNTYLVAQTDEGVIIIDQHALHERILYERFRLRILSGPLESQRLLIPETITVSPSQAQAAADHADLLGRLGLELSAFGPRSLAVQAFPSLLPHVEIATFVNDLLDRLAEAGQVETAETMIHAALDMMACKAAVKAGDPLTHDEIQALLAQRGLVEKSSNCPHGRPTTLQLSTRDLEKQFKRV